MKKRIIRTTLLLLLALMTTATMWAGQSPFITIEACEGLDGSIYLHGWCYDPDAPNTPLNVDVWVYDENNNPIYAPKTLKANIKRFGEDNQWHYNAFDAYIPITTHGQYKMYVWANDVTGDPNTSWNALAYLNHYLSVFVQDPYIVSYDANGGSGAPAEQLKSHGVNLTLSNTVPTKEGYNFACWTTESNGGGDSYNPGDTYTGNGDLTLYAMWTNSVNYVIYNTSTSQYELRTCASPITLTSGTTTMASNGLWDAWYVVKDNVTINSRIEVRGTVHLILCDGCTLTATPGITVNNGNTLIIHGQEAGTGTLHADATGYTLPGNNPHCAGIGNAGEVAVGNIIIHGGTIYSNGDEWAAGIGGGTNSSGGSITIYGGNIHAIAHGGSPGGVNSAQSIGRGPGGNVDINTTLAYGLRVTADNYTYPTHDRINVLRAKQNTYVAPCTSHKFDGNHECTYCGIHYTVTYNNNGATSGVLPFATKGFRSGQQVVLPSNTGNLEKNGYTFIGWNTNKYGTGTHYNPGDTFTITSNITLFAHWEPNTYTVHFDKNHNDATGTMADQTFTYNTAQNLTANAFIRSNYDFVGWSTTPYGAVAYTDQQSVNNLTVEQFAVVNLYAVWRTHLNLVGNDSGLPANETNSSIISAFNGLNANVTLAGRTLYKDGSWNTLVLPFNLSSFSSTPLEGATVKTLTSSAFNNGQLTLTFADATTIEAGKPYIVKWDSGSNVVSPTFNGVTVSNASTDIITEHVRFIGSYAPFSNNSYILDAHNPDGNAMHAVLYLDRTGYTLTGCYTDAAHENAVTTIPFAADGTVTLYPQWDIIHYPITYNLNGGSVATANPTSYTYIDENITLVNPTREGYYFVGWTGSNGDTPQTTVTITTGSTGSRSYTAVWTEIYTISYDGLEEDGTFPSPYPTTYTVLSEDITLVNPVRELYDFAGWTGSNGNTPQITVTIPQGSTGNRSYTASWSLKEGIYLSYNTETNEYETHAVDNPIHYTSGTTLGNPGQVTWYLVNSDTYEPYRITVSGTVNIILADGARLRVYDGIQVHSGNTLNIYGQEAGTGKLTASVSSSNEGNHAAIGTDNNHNGDKVLGTINIHGGTIEATGGAWSAGIGGGVGGGSGTINIYGGTISATANNPSDLGNQQAIGSGSSGQNVSKTLANGLRVYVGSNSTPVNYNNRIGSLGNRIVRVEPCTEHNWDGDHCTYCGAYRYHQITYNGNGNTGGSVPAIATFNVTHGITTATGTIAEAGTMERTGYNFTGWNTEADGSGTAYAPGETVELRQSITLYAQWNAITYTITYDLAGGYEPTIPNPDSYTIESGDITLNNPTRVDIDEQNGTTTNYLFMGWTGTGLDAATQTVTISHGSTGDRTYTATWDVSDIPFEGMEIDHYYQANELGRYYIKMPYPGEKGYEYDAESGEYIYSGIINAEETPKVVNIPEWFTTAFKVYDDGGKEGDVNYNPSESHIVTLILNAPVGKVFDVQGVMDMGTWYDDSDWLKVYDGTGTDNEIQCVINSNYVVDPFITSSNSIRFDLHIENGHYPSNFDLTVRLTTAPTSITLANDDSQSGQTNASVIASNDGAFANVTLDGSTLYRDGTWNTICLPFDIDHIDKTPLKGAIVKTLVSSTLSDGTLTLSFGDDLTALEAGKPYIAKFNDVPSYFVTDGSTDGGTLDEDLVDGNRNSDWWSDGGNGSFCEFEADGIMAVTSYTLTTGESVTNPTEWKLEGKLNADDEWTLIDHRDVNDTPADELPNEGHTDKTYSVASPGSYRYFRFTVIQTEEYPRLAELTLQGTYTPDTPMGNLENPTFNKVTIKNELHPFTSNGVTFGGNYSTLASTDGLLFDAHNTNGNAFHAALSASSFSVSGWCIDAERTTLSTNIPFNAATGNVTLYPVHLSVAGYGTGTDKWVFIASPVTGSIAPSDVVNLMGERVSVNPDVYNYDLYSFNQSGVNGEWENYHQHNTQQNPFLLVNGQGYLYAHQSDVNLFFNGTMNTGNEMTIDLAYDGSAQFAGYNLVGNPFPCEAYVNKPFYRMNTAGDDIEPVANYDSYTPTTIPPYTGIIVKADGNGERVTFSTSAPETSTGNNGNLSIALSQQTEATRGGSTTTNHDKAFVSFNQGTQLGKFVFNRDHAKLYIPQDHMDYAIAFSEKRGVMPVNFEPMENGTYTISVNPEGVEMAYLHLIDNLTGADVDLLVDPSYTFEGHLSDYASRFKLVFSARKSIEEIGDNESFAFIHNGEIIIEGDGAVQVIDMLGRIIIQRRDNVHTVSTDAMTPGIYVLRLINGDNVKTQKIVIR